jgi:guanine deaminase
MVHVHPTHEKGLEVQNPRFTNRPLGIPTLLYLATVGGAELCCLQNVIGRLKPGMAFDAIVASVRPETGNPKTWSMDEDFASAPDAKMVEAYLEKFLFCGDDRNVEKVFVQGKLIGGRSFGRTR